jgi:mannose-6-phosphate isomerase-like protein (cupin superfamily)
MQPTGPIMVSTSLPTSRSTAEHYVWGQECDGWHLLRTAGLSVIEERMPPGSREVRHWHARSRQFFYVLSGTLSMEVEGVRHELGARTGLELAPGLAHQATNESDRDAEFLVVSMPPSHSDRHEDVE